MFNIDVKRLKSNDFLIDFAGTLVYIFIRFSNTFPPVRIDVSYFSTRSLPVSIVSRYSPENVL